MYRKPQPNWNKRAKMGKNRSVLLLVGMVACSALVVVAMAGFVSSLRPRSAAAPAPTAQTAAKTAAKNATVPELPAEPTSKPEPVDSVRVPILMYHHIEELSGEQASDPDYQQLFVAPQAFRDQMSYLKDNGYHTITFAELVGAFRGEVALPANPVIITFDDGWDDIYTVAYPILREHGLRATFFIATNWIENLEGVVSWQQLEEMSAGGMEFGSHSFTHPYLTTADPDWRKYELEESKAALERHTGKTITALAYPYGLYDDTVIQAVKDAGYLTACTIDPGATATADTLLTLPRTWVYDWTSLEDFAALLTSS
jgi:peptidoglycan/xylan/chitin deacetylase (PgdA/CDA1 family)